MALQMIYNQLFILVALFIPMAPRFIQLFVDQGILLRVKIDGSPYKVNLEIRVHHSLPKFLLGDLPPAWAAHHDIFYYVISITIDDAKCPCVVILFFFLIHGILREIIKFDVLDVIFLD